MSYYACVFKYLTFKKSHNNQLYVIFILRMCYTESNTKFDLNHNKCNIILLIKICECCVCVCVHVDKCVLAVQSFTFRFKTCHDNIFLFLQ
jgi:hypothetical protein